MNYCNSSTNTVFAGTEISSRVYFMPVITSNPIVFLEVISLNSLGFGSNVDFAGIAFVGADIAIV